jgi:O-methyltransferase involved in polyketide biosynthesis
MSDDNLVNLTGVSETLLSTLYVRAMESQRPDALIKDEKAVELVRRASYDFDRIKLLHLTKGNKVVLILRNREFDRYARDFLARHPEAVVVHIGCGLDSRFERVDNGLAEWYDLDLPDVIDLRRKLIGGERARYHLLSCSVLEDAWLAEVVAHSQRPVLFIAEGLIMHLREEQNKTLVQMLYDHFPGAELVFDAYSPFHNWVSNLQTTRFGFRTHWGIWNGKKIESWGDGIRLLSEWGWLDHLEPRISYYRWIGPIEALIRTLRIYHFQLGKARN